MECPSRERGDEDDNPHGEEVDAPRRPRAQPTREDERHDGEHYRADGDETQVLHDQLRLAPG
eukprot:2645598-Prymnesium_polylepis.1